MFTAPSLKSAPKRGDVVLCKGIDEDEDYYRAIVINSNSKDDEYQMMYLDHGESKIKIYKLENIWMKYCHFRENCQEGIS